MIRSRSVWLTPFSAEPGGLHFEGLALVKTSDHVLNTLTQLYFWGIWSRGSFRRVSGSNQHITGTIRGTHVLHGEKGI